MRKFTLSVLVLMVAMLAITALLYQPAKAAELARTSTKIVTNPDGSVTATFGDDYRENLAVRAVTREFTAAQKKELWLNQINAVASRSDLNDVQRFWLKQLARHVAVDVDIPKTEANYAIYDRVLYTPAKLALGEDLYRRAILVPDRKLVEQISGVSISYDNQPVSMTIPAGATCGTAADQISLSGPGGPYEPEAKASMLAMMRARCMCHTVKSNEMCGAGMWCCDGTRSDYCPTCEQPQSEDCGEGEFWRCNGVCWVIIT